MMPVINPYRQDVSSQGQIPNQAAQGSDFGGPGMFHFGQDIMQAGHDLAVSGDILRQHAAQQEVTDVDVWAAKTEAESILRMREKANATNPEEYGSFSQDFNADLQTELTAAGEHFTTREGQQAFRRHAGTLSAHFLKAAGLEQVKLAGIYAATKAKVLLQSNQNILLDDPYQFGRVLANTREAIGNIGGLSGEQREPLMRLVETELAKSAVQGIIKSGGGGTAALKTLQAGTFDDFLKGDDKHRLVIEAEVAVRGEEADQRRQEAADARAKKAEHEAANEVLVNAWAEKTLTWPMIRDANIPPTGDGSKEHWKKMIDAQAKETLERPIKHEPMVYLNVLKGIRTGTITNESQIEDVYATSAEKGRGITEHDLLQLRNEVKDLRTPEGEKLGESRKSFFAGYGSLVSKANPALGKLGTPEGLAQLSDFEQYARDKETEFRKEGKNPHDLYRRGGKDFLGNPETMAMFQKTMPEVMKDFSQKLHRAPSPVAPEVQQSGETIEQMMKRIDAEEAAGYNPDSGTAKTGATPENLRRRPGETAPHYFDRLRNEAQGLRHTDPLVLEGDIPPAPVKKKK